MLVFGFAFKPLGIILPAPLKARAQRIAHIENMAVRNQPACPLENTVLKMLLWEYSLGSLNAFQHPGFNAMFIPSLLLLLVR